MAKDRFYKKSINSDAAGTFVTTTADVVLDSGVQFVAGGNGAGITITLPDSADAGVSPIYFRNVSAGAMTLVASGTDTIAGGNVIAATTNAIYVSTGEGSWQFIL